MTTEALLSTSITNLNATPRVQNTAGRGAPGRIHFVDGKTAAALSGTTTGSTYRMVRIPSDCVVKRVRACLNAAVTTFTVDIGLYYSNTNDGTSSTNVAAADTAIDADFFGSAVALAAIVVPTEYTRESGEYSVAEMFQEVWQAAGLSTDPGGFFDVVMTTTATTNDNSVALIPYLSCEYITRS